MDLLPAAELIPPDRPKEDVLDELIRDLKILKKQTYKGKRKRETEAQRVVVQRSGTSEQDTTEAPNTEDGYPKDGEPWTMVLGRKEKKKQQLLQSQHKQQDGIAAKKISSTMRRPKSTVSPRKEKKTAAVAITTMSDETTYKKLMQLAKRNISLEELKIDDIDCRRAMTGGLLLQIHGKDNQSKAEQLTDKLQSLFASNKNIKVYKPQQMAELRIMGIDDAITCEDIVQTIVKISGCRVSEVRIGPIRIAGRGMGTVWVRCPLTAANKLAEMGKIKVGWFSARVEMLPGRRLHCFRCLRPGHAKGQCTAEDFSNRCYNWSDIGHKLQ
ncbi:hypothetical protein RF55_21733, partial [Lasius niger]